MHEDDEIGKREKKDAGIRRLFEQARQAGAGDVKTALKHQGKSALAAHLQEIRSNRKEVEAFLRRDVSEMNYEELKRLHIYAFLLFVHAVTEDQV